MQYFKGPAIRPVRSSRLKCDNTDVLTGKSLSANFSFWMCLSMKWDPSICSIGQFWMKQCRPTVKSDLSTCLQLQRPPKIRSSVTSDFHTLGFLFLLLISLVSAAGFCQFPYFLCKCPILSALETSPWQHSDFSKYLFKHKQSIWTLYGF